MAAILVLLSFRSFWLFMTDHYRSCTNKTDVLWKKKFYNFMFMCCSLTAANQSNLDGNDSFCWHNYIWLKTYKRNISKEILMLIFNIPFAQKQNCQIGIYKKEMLFNFSTFCSFSIKSCSTCSSALLLYNNQCTLQWLHCHTETLDFRTQYKYWHDMNHLFLLLKYS